MPYQIKITTRENRCVVCNRDIHKGETIIRSGTRIKDFHSICSECFDKMCNEWIELKKSNADTKDDNEQQYKTTCVQITDKGNSEKLHEVEEIVNIANYATDPNDEAYWLVKKLNAILEIER